MSIENDRFLDWLEEQRLKDQGYSFTDLDRASLEDPALRSAELRAIEKVIERL